jgi:hypothetical protein
MLRLALLLGMLAACVPMFGQSLAKLTGTVTDNTGAVVASAKVTARSVSTGVVSDATTNASGVYQFPFLPPAEYEVSCEFQGFKKAVRSGVVLETATTKSLDFTLEVGAVTESVEVNATVPLLESETSSVGQFIERTTVLNMPLESRRTAGLVRLMGMVAFRDESGPEQVPLFSMAGGRSQNQIWQLDGGNVQNTTLGVPQLQLNPPAESLQEFKAEASNYSAEFGRTGGGLIQMTTRSGGNNYHGAAYEFLRNQALDTRTFFAQSKAPLRYNIFGASFGGPIRRDKTFFFMNYEGARRRDGSTVANTIVPRPAEVQGDFSARTGGFRLLDPLNGQQFAGNIIPQTRIDPVARAFAALYPAPNIASDPTRAPAANYIVNVSDKLTQDLGTLKIDHNLGTADRLSGRYSIIKAPQELSAIFPNTFADTRGGPRDHRIHNVVATWIHSFSATFLNEFRYNYATRRFINRSLGTDSKKNGELGLKGVSADDFAQLIPTGQSNLGTTPVERIQNPILTHQWVNNLTLIRGNHSLKFGGEMRYSSNKDQFRQTSNGTFTFSDRATGSGMASLLLGHVTGAGYNQVDPLLGRTDYFGAFIQNDWKVSKRLTLNMGLRWEMDTPRWEKYENRQSGFAFAPINPVSGLPGVVTFSGRDGRSKYAHDFDKNNFSPRFGFAYKGPRGMVLRGGYALVYSGAYAGAVANPLIAGFSLNGNFTSTDGGFTRAFAFRDGMPAIVREPLGPGFGAVAFGAAPRFAPDFIQQDHVSPYSHQYNFTIQKELFGNLLFEAAYIANLSHKLGGQNLNVNQIPLVNGRGPATQSQTARPFPHFNNVTLLSPPWGNSTYHALNLKIEKRYSNGLNFLANYTWSKFLDDVEANNEVAGGEGNGYTHISLRNLDKSYSGNDIRHRLIASSVYEIPVGKGRRLSITNPFANAIVGGWAIGVVAEFRAGAPWGVTELTNTTNTFSASQRPNLSCSPILDSSRPRSDYLAQYFDTSCFSAPGTGIFGNAARNLGFGPGYAGIDASVTKRWALTERYGLQFRSDFYNVPNRPNFASPASARGRGDFGRINSTIGTGRQIQLSLRFEF